MLGVCVVSRYSPPQFISPPIISPPPSPPNPCLPRAPRRRLWRWPKVVRAPPSPPGHSMDGPNSNPMQEILRYPILDNLFLSKYRIGHFGTRLAYAIGCAAVKLENQFAAASLVRFVLRAFEQHLGWFVSAIAFPFVTLCLLDALVKQLHQRVHDNCGFVPAVCCTNMFFKLCCES